jgi:hypothetical protein
VYRCVTQQGWGTYLAGRRKARQPLGTKNGVDGGPQGVVEVPLVLQAGCGALVGRTASCGGELPLYLSCESVPPRLAGGSCRLRGILK